MKRGRMSKPLSFRHQVECLIVTLEEEVKSLERRMEEADDEMELFATQSQIFAMKYGYHEALEFERSELKRILKAAKIAFDESTALHPS